MPQDSTTTQTIAVDTTQVTTVEPTVVDSANLQPIASDEVVGTSATVATSIAEPTEIVNETTPVEPDSTPAVQPAPVVQAPKIEQPEKASIATGEIEVYSYTPEAWQAPEVFPDYPHFNSEDFKFESKETKEEEPVKVEETAQPQEEKEEITTKITTVDTVTEKVVETDYQSSYIPDWTDADALKELSEANPKDFTIHTIKTEPEAYKLKLEVIDTDWMFWFILSSVAIITWIKVFFNKNLSNTLSATINGQITNRLFRETNSLSAKVSLALYVIFALNLGLFIFQIAHYYGASFGDAKGYLITLGIALGILIIYGIKDLSLRIIGFMADISAPIAEYIHIVGIYNKSLGILLYPIIIGLQYAQTDIISKESILYIGFGLIALQYLARLIRGIVISIRSNFSVFYAILYLCALEIAPNMLLYKIATSLF